MPTPQRPQHRSTFRPALLLSLVLHAGLVVLLVVLVRHPERPAPPPRPATRVTLRPLPRLSTPAPPAPTAPSGSRPQRPATASAPAQAERAAPVAAGAPAPPGGAPRPLPGDAPIELFPGSAVAHGAGPMPPGDPGATTGRDAPESPEAEGRRVQQRVDTWRREGMAAYRVAVGRGRLLQGLPACPPGGDGSTSSGRRAEARGSHRRPAVDQRLARRRSPRPTPRATRPPASGCAPRTCRT